MVKLHTIRTTIVLWQRYTSTYVPWHAQLRTGGFFGSKDLLPFQHIQSKEKVL